ncbi:MAG: SRPBCC domain-containing protein [Bacteroidota bacterium]
MESIILEKILDAPIDLVWLVITQKDHLKNWYFDFSEQWKLELGHQFEWLAGPPDGKQWLHRGTMLEIIEEKKLVHTWEYPGYSGEALVDWELFAVSENITKLVFKYNFLVPFEPEEEALNRKNFIEGWDFIILTTLPEYVKKQLQK